MEPEKTLICMECGGTAHLLSHRPGDDPFEAGDYAAYVCEDCSQRIDIVLEDDDEVGLFAGQ